MRITADGHLKVCLFGSDETNLRDPMRDGATDDELLALAHGALSKKHAVLGGHGTMDGVAAQSDTNRPMIKIGG